jgi:hypothetical protein
MYMSQYKQIIISAAVIANQFMYLIMQMTIDNEVCQSIDGASSAL